MRSALHQRRRTASGLIVPSSAYDYSQQTMPSSAPPGFTPVYRQDFLTARPVGAFTVGGSGSADDGLILPSSAAYNDYRNSLNLYPDGGRYPNSPAAAQYFTTDTVSTKATDGANGVFDMACFTENGIAKSAWMRPITTADQVGSDGKRHYVSYCHIASRARVPDISNTSNFGGVMLLIPNNWPQGGEIDYFELAFNESIGGFFHYADPAATQDTSGNYQLPFKVSPAAYMDRWHRFDTLWKPDHLIHLMDGIVVLDTHDRVPSDLQKFVFQDGVHSNAMPSPGAVAHLQLDWVILDTYNG